VSHKQTINERQHAAASSILNRLRNSINPDFLGLVSRDGHAIISFTNPGFTDIDSLASLAASAYAATRQLALLVSGADFTMMFNEGDKLNVHIAQVSDSVLLVVCFRRVAELGKVRVLTNRALEVLADSMAPDKDSRVKRGAGTDEGSTVY
jgi:predicted regulator of Ras-like GTPase activity (Roadblock/LC7/MglB family)